MADQISSFEHQIEADLVQLAAEVKKNREHAELKNAHEKELVKEAIRGFARTGAQNTPQTTAPAVKPQSTNPLPQYAQNAPAEVKLEIEYLLDIALRQGIGKALVEADKAPYFVKDAFHDALAGRLYPELKKRGIVT